MAPPVYLKEPHHNLSCYLKLFLTSVPVQILVELLFKSFRAMGSKLQSLLGRLISSASALRRICRAYLASNISLTRSNQKSVLQMWPFIMASLQCRGDRFWRHSSIAIQSMETL